MNLKLILANIANVEADALIFSTNVQLSMTGGVGAALKNKYGFHVQMDLVEAFKQSRKIQANVGDVYITNPQGTPWKLLFNTIATSESFYTRTETVIDILRHCLRHCSDRQDIRSVVCSPIGTGFGDLTSTAYCECLTAVLAEHEEGPIHEFILACYDQHQFNELCTLLPAWEHAILEKPRVFFEGRKKKP